jgi:hypothetical protein
MPNYAVQRRRGTTAQHSSFTGLEGELSVDTTKDIVVVHDGSTAGGRAMLREDVDNLANDAISGDKVHGGTISGSVILDDGANATTQSAGNATTLLATTAFVTTAVAGENTLAEMGDVALSTPADAALLLYDTGSSTWRDAAMSGDATISDTGAITVSGSATADAWSTARTLSFTGDVTGSGSVDGSGNVATALTIAADSVALGTDTTGNYVLSVADSGGGNITVTNGVAEGGAVTLNTAQDIATGDSPTFVGLTLTGDLTVGGTTTTVNSTVVSIADAMIQLASGNSSATAAYIGMQAERGSGSFGDPDAYFVWEESSDRWRATTSPDGTNHTDANMQCGTLNGTATAALYSDLAERYSSDAVYEAGTVVSFGGANEVTQSTEMYDTRVAGVVSTNPAHLMNAEAGTNETHPAIALSGRVPVKVMGTVRKGDLMVTSAQTGVAMAADERVTGAIIGKAIEAHTGEGIGVIEVLIAMM